MAYFPVMAYADLQVLGEAVAATKSLKDDVLAAYIHKSTFDTMVGNSASARTANGPKSACSPRSSRTSKATASTNSAI